MFQIRFSIGAYEYYGSIPISYEFLIRVSYTALQPTFHFAMFLQGWGVDYMF